MVLLGTKLLGEYPLGGEVIQIGDGIPPYPPDAIYATADDFKLAVPIIDSNYLLYDYDESPSTYDPYWNGWNDSEVFSFAIDTSFSDNKVILTNGSIQLKLGLYL